MKYKFSSRRREAGNAMVEFSLVLLPLTVLLVSLVESARVAWAYQTLASAAKTVTRNAVVHGEKCVELNASCSQSVSTVMTQLGRESIGLDPSQMSAWLQSGEVEKTCAPVSSCAADGTAFPAADDRAVGRPVTIRLRYQIRPILGLVAKQATTWTLTASSREAIQF